MLHAGASLDQLPGPKYLAALRFAELALRAPLPRASTLRQKRAQLPKDLVLSLRAPQSAVSGARGALRFDEGLEAGVSWMLAARDALDARFVVLPTPTDLTPGARSRDLLAAYVERLPRDPARPFVWAPRGPWEPEQAEQVAQDLGLVLAFDPLEEICPPGPLAYARLIAMGARRSFSPASLEEALSEVEQADEAFVVIESERAFPQASTLQRMAAGSAADEPADDDDLDEDEDLDDEEASEDDSSES
jgi:hypothetical protein